MNIGKLNFKPAKESFDLIAKPVREAIDDSDLAASVFVAPIDASLADTAAFCEAYDVGLDISTNCLVIEARRGDRTWYVACLVLATDKADINGVVRKHLDARKVSFASMDRALELTKMEYGGVTPVGLPSDWMILIDEAVMQNELVVIGGGIRGSKIVIKTTALANLGGAEVIKLSKST